MRMATWNVSSLTARLNQVLTWLAANPVDVLCLRELKMTDDKFPLDALREVGYEAAIFGQKTYNGVAILSRTRVRDALAPTGDRIEDLHVWQVGPGHFAAIVSIASAAPREAPAYKALLASIDLLSHVTVETERLPGG